MEINFLTLSVIVGSFLPLVISLVKGANMTTQVKRVIAVLVSALAAVIVVGADAGWTFDAFSWEQAVQSFGLIFALAKTTYSGFWEDTAVEVRLENVGSHT